MILVNTFSTSSNQLVGRNNFTFSNFKYPKFKGNHIYMKTFRKGGITENLSTEIWREGGK